MENGSSEFLQRAEELCKIISNDMSTEEKETSSSFMLNSAMVVRGEDYNKEKDMNIVKENEESEIGPSLMTWNEVINDMTYVDGK